MTVLFIGGKVFYGGQQYAPQELEQVIEQDLIGLLGYLILQNDIVTLTGVLKYAQIEWSWAHGKVEG